MMDEPTTSRLLRDLALQMVKYYAVAGFVALGYLGTYAAALAIGIQYFVAILVTQALTIAWAFPVYRFFVFRSAGRWLDDFWRFLSVWAGGAVAGFLLTPALVEFFGVHPFVAQVISIVLVSLASFTLHRLFTFRRGSGPGSSTPGARP